MSTSTAEISPFFEATPGALDEPTGLYEVVDGGIREKALGVYEAETASILQEVLGPSVRSRGLGRVVTETRFDLRPAVDRCRCPDSAFVSAATLPLGRRTPRVAAWAVVPELAVEVVSPTNSANEVARKVEEYFQAGVRRVWVVDPALAKLYDYGATTAVRILALGDTLDAEDLFPGFAMPMRDLLGDAEAV